MENYFIKVSKDVGTKLPKTKQTRCSRSMHVIKAGWRSYMRNPYIPMYPVGYACCFVA